MTKIEAITLFILIHFFGMGSSRLIGSEKPLFLTALDRSLASISRHVEILSRSTLKLHAPSGIESVHNKQIAAKESDDETTTDTPSNGDESTPSDANESTDSPSQSPTHSPTQIPTQLSGTTSGNTAPTRMPIPFSDLKVDTVQEIFLLSLVSLVVLIFVVLAIRWCWRRRQQMKKHRWIPIPHEEKPTVELLQVIDKGNPEGDHWGDGYYHLVAPKKKKAPAPTEGLPYAVAHDTKLVSTKKKGFTLEGWLNRQKK